MLRLAADEDFNRNIVWGLQRERPDLDILRVQDADMAGSIDPKVLAWAAEERRVLLTHDVSTMSRHAYDRVAAGKPMSGLVVVGQSLPIGQVIEDILVIVDASTASDWEGKVEYLPL